METELERMIIRLIGDGSSYRGMMTQAQADTKQGASAIEQGAGKAGKSWSEAFGISKEGLTSFISSAGSLIGGISLGGFLSEAKSAYADQIAAEKQLGAILKVNGREVDTLMESYKSFANEMQSQTGVADENVLALLRQAETLGVTGESAQRAVKNYLGMEAAGIPLRGGLRALIGLEQGHSEMLKMTFPELRNVKNETERAARAQELLGNTFELARLEGQKGSTRLRVAWNELMEDFGKTVFELAKPVTEIKAMFVEWLAALSPFTKQAIVMFVWLTAGALTFWGVMTLGWTTFWSVFNLSTGGILLIIAGIAIAVSYWIDQMGGVGKAWEAIKGAGIVAWSYIKQKALEFWEWVKPVAYSGLLFLKAVWEGAVEIATWAWQSTSEVVKTAWEYYADFFHKIGLTSADTWKSIRDNVMYFFIAAEFKIRNFSLVWDTVVYAIAYGAIWMYQTLRDGLIDLASVFHGSFNTLLEIGIITVEGMLRSFQGLWVKLRAGWAGTAAAAAAVVTGDDPLIAYRRAFDLEQAVANRQYGLNVAAETQEQRNARMVAAFNRGANDMARALGNVIPDMEATLTEIGAMWEALGAESDISLEEFTRQRLEELANMQAPALGPAAGLQLGQQIGAGVNAGIHKEIKPLDATSLFSADALAKVEKQMEMINKSPTAGSNRDAAIEDGAEGMQRLQREGNGFLAQMARREPVVLQPAGL